MSSCADVMYSLFAEQTDAFTFSNMVGNGKVSNTPPEASCNSGRFKQLAYWIPLQIANIPFAVLGKNVGIFWDKPNCRVLC